MGLLRDPRFFRAYRLLPHGALNRAARLLTTLEHPRWAVDAVVKAWVRRDRIALDDFETRPWRSVEDFFLRRLREGARPIGEGIVCPADGVLVSSGTLERGTILQVKGKPISVDRLVNGKSARERIDARAFEGGTWATVFLTPRGYHYVHMPFAATVRDVRWLPGRFFPQNEDALRHIWSERHGGIYEQNERAVLRLGASGGEALMVMVGASLIGGIHLRDLARTAWVGPGPFTIDRRRDKGEELGHFSFGSTVVLILPKGTPATTHPIGSVLRMGERLV